MKLKLNDKIIEYYMNPTCNFEKIDDEYIIFKESGSIFLFEGVGSFIFEKILNNTDSNLDMEQLIQLFFNSNPLKNSYNSIKQEVYQFIEQLISKEVLIVK